MIVTLCGRAIRPSCACIAVFFLGTLLGCHQAHFTVQSAPVAPEQAPSFKTVSPEIPVIVQLANFTIGSVDTQYTDEEKDAFRRHMAVAIPNVLQEQLGRKQVFSNVARSTIPIPQQCDFVITGDYEFFERLGTGGREWIPFYGTFGGKINEAWVRAAMTVIVVDAKSGSEILRKRFPEEHRDRTSVYQRPNVGYMQGDYVASIAGEITDAIRNNVGHVGQVPDKRGKVENPTPERTIDVGSTAERLRKLESLRKEGLISQQEFDQRRTRILDEAVGQ